MMPKSPKSEGAANPSYAVGYGKPPKAGQFKPGQSGNPNGKQKGQPSLAEMMLAEAARIVKVKHGDEIVHLTKKRVPHQEALRSGGARRLACGSSDPRGPRQG